MMKAFDLPALSRRLVVGALAAAAFGAQANEARYTYEVTVTNITYNQRFTPLLLATHQPTIRFFALGQPALPQLATLAEEGNVAPLRALLDGSPLVRATAAGNGLLDPGQSISFRIEGNPWKERLSLAAMLIPTNDAFVAVNAMQLPFPGWPAQSATAIAYDAGSEVNDEPLLRRVRRLRGRRARGRRRRLRACAPRHARHRRLQAQRARLAQPGGAGQREAGALRRRLTAARGGYSPPSRYARQRGYARRISATCATNLGQAWQAFRCARTAQRSKKPSWRSSPASTRAVTSRQLRCGKNPIVRRPPCCRTSAAAGTSAGAVVRGAAAPRHWSA
jgi:Spondin_N